MNYIKVDPKPFFEGVVPDDYCRKCGALLNEIVTQPNGEKKTIKHETDSELCEEYQRSEQAYQNSCFDVEMRESELAEMEY